MIEVQTSQKGNIRTMKCNLNGTLPEIANDTLHILRQIFRQIAEDRDPIGAELYKNLIIASVNDKDLHPFSTEPLEGTIELRLERKEAGTS